MQTASPNAIQRAALADRPGDVVEGDVPFSVPAQRREEAEAGQRGQPVGQQVQQHRAGAGTAAGPDRRQADSRRAPIEL